MDRSQEIILRFLAAYRRARLKQELAAGLLALLTVVSSIILLGALSSAIGVNYSFLRFSLLSLGGLGVCVVAYKYVIFPARKLRPGGLGLAREIEQRLGKQDLRLVSAVELMDSGRRGDSADLIMAHLAQEAESIREVKLGELLVQDRLRRLLLVASAALGAVMVFALLWPHSLLAGTEQLLHGDSAGDLEQSEDRDTWVGDMVVEYVYPSYTGLSDRRVEGSDGTILAMPGTRVKLSAVTDRDISRAELKFADEVVPVKVASARKLTAQMVIMEPGSYRFVMVDRDGKQSRSRRAYPVQITPDRAPLVRLLKPKKDMVVRERDSVELVYDAKDDFGLEEVRLVWRVPSRAGVSKKNTLKRLGGNKTIRSTYSWSLASLALVPGEQVQFYIEAVDNDTVLGPKAGRSATVTLKVFSAMDQHRDLMKEVQRVFERMLGVLAAHLELEPEARPESETLEDHEGLADGLEKLIDQMGDSIKALQKDELAWPPLLVALRNMRRRLSEASNQARWTLRTVGLDKKASKRELRSLASLSSWRIGILEKDVLYLEDLLDMVRLEDLQHLAQKLATDQKRLSDLMDKYKKAPDEQTRRAIMDEIARIKQRIAKLLARQREVLKSVRDEYFNPDALKKLMSDRLSMSSLDRIQRLLMEGKMDQAMAELEKLRKQIENLQGAIEKSQQNYGKERYSELAKAMAKMNGELNQIVKQQSKLMDRTGVIRQRILDKLSKRRNSKQKKIIDRVLQRLSMLQRRVGSMGTAGLDQFVIRQKEDVLGQADGLEKLLKTKALGQALDTASDLLRSTTRLKQLLSFFGFSESEKIIKKIEHSKEMSTKAVEDAQFIYRELGKLIPPASSMMNESERKQISDLQRQQKQLRRRLDKMGEQMRGINNKAPLFGQPMLNGMNRAGEQMRKATDKLRRTDPTRAWPHQRDALGELQQIQEQMKKSCKIGGQGQGMPLPMGRSSGAYDNGMSGEMSHQAVEIPGEDEFNGPEKYRKELIDGMKDPVPEEYKPQVQRYYEELVK